MLSLDESEQIERYERWQHTAALSTHIANILRNENTPVYKIEDFMPVSLPGETPKHEKVQTPEEQLELIKILNAAMGGEIVEM